MSKTDKHAALSRRIFLRYGASTVVLVAAGCVQKLDSGKNAAADTAAGDADSGSADGGSLDGGLSDGGSADGGSADGGSADGGSEDGGSADGGAEDGGAEDGGAEDGGAEDGGSEDGGSEPLESCEVTPSTEEGPFYVRGDERSDITEGLEGAELTIRLLLVDAETCEPLVGVMVDTWMASPEGLYSGVDNSIGFPGGADTAGATYMRGRQPTDASGKVSFTAVFPGWYEVTPPHLHFTAEVTDTGSFTWQFFLDDDFSEAVYTSEEPYSERGAHVVRTSDSDWIPEALLITPEGSTSSSVIDVIIAIDKDSLSGRPSEYGR